MNMFAEGALSNAYGWQPEIWNTPDDDELANLEASLCLPGLCFGGFFLKVLSARSRSMPC